MPQRNGLRVRRFLSEVVGAGGRGGAVTDGPPWSAHTTVISGHSAVSLIVLLSDVF